MWGMSQPGTVGNSSLREILCVCLSPGKGWLLQTRGSLGFLDSEKEPSPLIYFHKLSKGQTNGSLGKGLGLVFVLVLFFSLRGDPADENKLWNDLCLCNRRDCVILRPWNRNSGAARQGIYLGGVFLGKSGERERENNNTKKKPGGGDVCNDHRQNKITNDQPRRLKL